MKKFIEELERHIMNLKDAVEASEKLREHALNFPISSLDITAIDPRDLDHDCHLSPDDGCNHPSHEQI